MKWNAAQNPAGDSATTGRAADTGTRPDQARALSQLPYTSDDVRTHRRASAETGGDAE